jgi:hypothetical protein
VLNDFFVFRAERFNVLEEYFDSHTLSRKKAFDRSTRATQNRTTLMSDTRSLHQTKSLFSEEQMSTSHTDNSHEESKQQTDQNLLLARQKHHCTPIRV